jgi:hypothetical protein
MSLPYSILELISSKVDKRFPGASTGLLEDEGAMEGAMAENSRQVAAAVAAVEASVQLTGMAMSSIHQPYLVQALAIEHPTILGQTAKAIASAVCLSSGYDPLTGDHAKPLFGQRIYCHRDDAEAHGIIHPVHDGRLTCGTVVGAILMSRQPLI